MTLVIACFNIPLMAFLVIDRIRKEPEIFIENKKQLLIRNLFAGKNKYLSIVIFDVDLDP